MPFDEFSIFWYGKMVRVNLVEFADFDDRIRLSVIISHCESQSTCHFVLPCKENMELKHHDNVLMVIPKSFHTSLRDEKETYTYVNATIMDIKESASFNEIVIKTSKDMELGALLRGNLTFQQNNIREIDACLVKFCNLHNNTHLYAVLSKIKRCIKGHFSRAVYRELGGISMHLIANKTMEDGVSV